MISLVTKVGWCLSPVRPAKSVDCLQLEGLLFLPAPRALRCEELQGTELLPAHPAHSTPSPPDAGWVGGRR